MVTPLAFMAATPVGATTILDLWITFLSSSKNVVLPVPALPVRKIFLEVFST